MRRTQLSLEERQYKFLKLVAALASWRIQHDPLQDIPMHEDLSAPESNADVSMAEVVRFLIEDRVAHLTSSIKEGYRPFDNGPPHDPSSRQAPTRMQEIAYATVDGAIYLNRTHNLAVPDHPGKVPDSRRP